jgi:molybdenum cofactor cytidylyltransferase
VSDLRGVLLAAGASTRFGSAKLLHPLEGGVPMAVLAARQLLRALPDSVAVVRPGDEELKARLSAEGIGIVVNPDADDGMGVSLACGVRATTQATGWVIALADMPFIQTETIVTVAHAIKRGCILAAPVYKGRRGHPVGFGRVFFAELVALSSDAGAREIIEQHKKHLVLIPVDDPGIDQDVDSLADLGKSVYPDNAGSDAHRQLVI